MTVFNPNPQLVQEEDFRGYTKPISSFEGSKAAGTALSGIGQTLAHTGEFVKDVGKVQEFNTRQAIENDPIGLAKAQKSREASNDAYQNFFDKNEQLQTSINAPNAGVELIQPGVDKASLPVDIRNAEQIITAQGQAKLDTKINQVLLAGEVDASAKRLREKYPDHVDYIDHLYERAGFGNPANRKQQALQQYYLAANAGKDDEKKAALALARAHPQIPGIMIGIGGQGPGLMEDVQNNKPGAQQLLQRTIGKYLSDDYLLHRAITQEEGNDKLAASSAQKNLDIALQSDMNNEQQTMYERGGFRTYGDMTREIADYQSGRKPVDTEAVQRLNLQLVGARQQFIDRWIKKTTEPFMQEGPLPTTHGGYGPGAPTPVLDKYGNKITLASRLGGVDKARAQIMGAVDFYDEQIKAVNNHDFGLATHMSQMLDATTDKDYATLMADKELGPYVRVMRAMTKANSQWGQHLFELAIPDATGKMNSWFKNHKVSNFNLGDPAIDTVKVIAENQTVLDASLARHYIQSVRDLWKTPAEGGLASDDSKRMAAKSYFQNSNGITSYFPNDTTVKVRGRDIPVPGRMSMFRELTDDRVTKEMHRLGPETWNMYKNFAETEHGSFLFRNQIRNLMKIADDPDLVTMWDNEKGEFHVEQSPTAKRQGVFTSVFAKQANAKSTSYNDAQPIVKQVNEGLKSMKTIAAEEGISPTLYALRKLQEIDFDFEGVSGIPAEMLKSLHLSTRPGTKPEFPPVNAP